MRYVLIRTQLLFVSVILFITFMLMMMIVSRYNRRWDFTQEKMYSLADSTRQILQRMGGHKLEVLAFYPQEDPARKDIEVFFKQIEMTHPNFKYAFYDPDRVPRLAKENHIKDIYTVVIRYQDRMERISRPTEESFANALLRLADPRVLDLCFSTGHNEASIAREDRNGMKMFRDVLEYNNYALHEIILTRDGVPDRCQVLVVAGPHRDMDPKEYEALRTAFDQGKGIFFMIDPMDPGTGQSFHDFFKAFGIFLGNDVIVDKMSRMVGGDFLVPLVNQYLSTHPITADFKITSFFPVARTVQPSTDNVPDMEVSPLAFTGSGSWAESDLGALEKGDASFQAESDLSGPLALAVASEKKTADGKSGGRLIVVGDSDFITNAYVDLSGNEDLALRMIHWLAKDDRAVAIPQKTLRYKPLFMTPVQQRIVLALAILGFPAFYLLSGMLRIFIRQKTS
ncbi:MAG TPA: Gldg family protein [Verrucomicrobiae bacterium]|nr:Gldg family protein [Verrucomicrobiae bacterium]